MMKKFPPIEKILEAYTAIAEGHVKLENDQALVTSSNEAKTYTVTFHDNTYTSNDNASYWQGYLGYPGIAVLRHTFFAGMSLNSAGDMMNPCVLVLKIGISF